MMDAYNDLIAFQFVQRNPESLEVRVKTRRYDASTEARLRQDIIDRFGDRIDIAIVNNEEFIQSAEGKKRVIVSEVKGHDFAS